MASQIVVREVELEVDNNKSFEILSGDNFLVIGVTHDANGGATLSAVTVDGLDAEFIVQDQIANTCGAELWHFHNPTVGAAIIIGATGAVGNLAFFVAKCNLAHQVSTVRDSQGEADVSIDFLAVTVNSDPRDKVFYVGKRDGGSPAWQDGIIQTAEQRDSRMAYEDGSSPTASAGYGVAPDAKICAVGASIRGPSRAGGPQGWFG
jgi:hypothetical protein